MQQNNFAENPYPPEEEEAAAEEPAMQQNNFAENPYPLENLFVGHFPGDIKGIADTVEGPIDLDLWGELSFYATNKGENFEIQALQRALIVGAPVDPGKPDPIGVLSLGGSPGLVMEIYDNILPDIPMNLHYRKLTRDDPDSPRFEKIGGQITWEDIEIEGDDEIWLVGVSFSTDELEEADFVTAVKIVNDEPVKIKLTRASKENIPHLPCPLPGDCELTLSWDHLRQLSIRFINLTSSDDISTEVLIQVEKICDIWGRKAALHLIYHEIVDVPSGEWDGFDQFGDGHGSNRGDIPHRSPYHIDVVVVNELSVTVRDTEINNGVTYDWGTFDAICIISHNALVNEPLICAHELSHVFNLDHSDHPIYDKLADPPPVGADDSIADVPFTNINTEFNRIVFKDEDSKISPYFTIAAIVPYCPDS